MTDRSTVITPPGDTAWVYDPKHNEIDFISADKASLYTYSLNSGAFTRSLSIGGAPTSIAITPDGQDLVIGNKGTVSSGGKDYVTLTRINLETNVIDRITSPSVAANGEVLHVVVDANGSAIFNFGLAANQKAYMTFDAAAATPVAQEDAVFNTFLVGGGSFDTSSQMLTSPDHRFILVGGTRGEPSPLALYDTASSGFVSVLDPFHYVRGFQTGRGDVTNSGMIVNVTYDTIIVFDRNLQLLQDLSRYQQSTTVGAAFSQDARELFIWDEGQKTLLVFDTQTWAKTASLTTSTGGVSAGYTIAPAHAVQVVDHGNLLALDDGVHGVELIDLSARLGLTTGPSPTSPPPMPPLAGSTSFSHAVGVAGNMDHAQLSDLLPATIIAAESTGFSASGPGALAISLSGSGLTYVNNQLTAGVVTYVDFTDVQGGVTTLHFSASGGSWSASQFETWLINNDATGAFQTLLAGDDGVTGSSGPDLARGYDGNDVLMGRGGSDTLFGGTGNDKIYADAPADRMFFPGPVGSTYLRGEDGDDFMVGGQGFDDMNGNMGRDTLNGGLGDDWVVGGRDNDMLFGDAGNDIVYGNMGDDTCQGGDGDDVVRGGQANDVMYGGAGNDWMSGDRGDDTISGGGGADTFYIFAGSGVDRITDFSRAEGDRVQVDPGTRYTVSQDGADTIVDLGGGDRMVLVGVQASTLSSGWIIGG